MYGVPVSIKENFAYKVICGNVSTSPSLNASYTDRVTKYGMAKYYYSVLNVVQIYVYNVPLSDTTLFACFHITTQES